MPPPRLSFADLAARAASSRWPDVVGAASFGDEFLALDRLGACFGKQELHKTAGYKQLTKASRGVEALRRTALAAMQGLAWAAHVREPHVNTMVVYVGQSVATALLKRDLGAAEDEAFVVNQLRLACAVPNNRRTWMVELFPMIITSAAAYAGDDNRLKLHAEALDLLKRMRQWMFEYPYNYTAMRRAAEPISALLGEKPTASAVLKPGEPWADAALADLESLDGPARDAWRALLDHASQCNATNPSTKWLDRAATLVEPIGGEAFTTHVDRWLSLLVTPGPVGKQVVHRGQTYNNVPSEPSQDVLGGLAWFAAVTKHPKAFAVIADLAESSFRPIPRFGPRCLRVGKAAARALAWAGTLDAIGQLARLALRVRTPKGRKLVAQLLEEAITASGLSRQDVEETSVPDFGLKSGLATIPAGEFWAELDATNAYHPKLTWHKPGGAVSKSVAAIKKAHPAAVELAQRTLKDVEGMLPAQRTRLELLLRDVRTWRFDAWRQRYREHGVLAPMVRRLIWTIDGTPVVFVGGEARDVSGSAIDVPRAAEVAIWHPLGRPVEEIVAWRQRLEALGIAQPFKQAHREVYPVTDAELQTRTYSNRFAAHIVKTAPLIAIGQTRKWTVSLYGECTLQLPQFDLRAEYWCHEIQVDDAGLSGYDSYSYGPRYLSTDQVRFYRPNVGEPMPVADVPPLAFSEVMRDLDLFVAIASVGADPNWTDGGNDRYHRYWHDFSFGDLGETAKTRKAVLERLVPRLKIADRCSVTDKFLRVQGSIRAYKIHLGSGNILMEPNDQYLCIVPARGGALTAPDSGERVFLPFEGDTTLSVILSKAMLLAEDATITDETITHQIGTRPSARAQ
jgi:hypothetical protein